MGTLVCPKKCTELVPDSYFSGQDKMDSWK